jgi:hypothetical protein
VRVQLSVKRQCAVLRGPHCVKQGDSLNQYVLVFQTSEQCFNRVQQHPGLILMIAIAAKAAILLDVNDCLSVFGAW